MEAFMDSVIVAFWTYALFGGEAKWEERVDGS